MLAEVEAGNFYAPLISAQIRHFGVTGPAWTLGRRAPGERSWRGVLGIARHGPSRASVAVRSWPCRLWGRACGLDSYNRTIVLGIWEGGCTAGVCLNCDLCDWGGAWRVRPGQGYGLYIFSMPTQVHCGQYRPISWSAKAQVL